MGLHLKLTEAELLSFHIEYGDDGEVRSGFVETTRRFGIANYEKRAFAVAVPYITSLRDGRLEVTGVAHTDLGTTRFEVRSAP